MQPPGSATIATPSLSRLLAVSLVCPQPRPYHDSSLWWAFLSSWSCWPHGCPTLDSNWLASISTCSYPGNGRAALSSHRKPMTMMRPTCWNRRLQQTRPLRAFAVSVTALSLTATRDDSLKRSSHCYCHCRGMPSLDVMIVLPQNQGQILSWTLLVSWILAWTIEAVV